MQSSFRHIVRVLHIQSQNNDIYEVIVLLGDAEHHAVWRGPSLAPGDVFVASGKQPLRLIEKIGSAKEGQWTRDGDAMRWRKRDKQGRSRMQILHQRHIIRRSLRGYMDSEGFIEVDTPLLVHGTTPDANIHSFKSGDRYLIPSAEYQIKRMEVGGFDRIYTLTQNYRRGDGEGPTHNPEFTMLEWARVGQDLAALENDAERMTWVAHQALSGQGTVHYRNTQIDLAPPWHRMKVADAIKTYTGVMPETFSLPALLNVATMANIPLQNDWKDDVHFLFSLIMDHIRPYLGLKKPVFLQDWPSFETSSALEKNNFVAERSELFIGGLEISDGFPSLISYERQKQTFADQQQRRINNKTNAVELDQLYLKAMCEGLPKGAGMALGFDRLVMLLTGAEDIRSTLAFAWDEV